MAERPRLTLPLGAGVDRHAGAYVAEATSFHDLRNVMLGDGKLSVRRGLDLAVTLPVAGSVIGIYPVRATGKAVAFVYDTGGPVTVKAYLLNGTGTTATLIGTVWTFSGLQARIPRVIAADSYSKLLIAHDHASLSLRKQTRVYDVLAGTLTDLNAGTGLTTPQFRGVTRHLNYIFGWGWGTDADPDRPEIVRACIPAEPLNWDINHYFVAGQRDDAVLTCRTAGTVLSVQKFSQTFDIVGKDRATFGIFPGDELHGVVSSRASETIAGINYRWSHAGPRRSAGPGPSEDIGTPLDLAGVLPDVLAAASGIIADYTFTAYDPFTQELTWVFNAQWGFTLHLAELPNMKWSYRQYGTLLRSAGTIYDTSV